jgi:type 1 glutamine amidotransferase
MYRRQFARLRIAALGLAAGLAFAHAGAQEAVQATAFKGGWPGVTPAPGSLSVTPPPFGAAPASPTPHGIRAPTVKHVLVLGGTQGWHHDSVPSAMAGVFNWGRQTHLWEVEMRTDFALVNPKGGQPMNAGFRPEGLRDFDAIVIASATGDWGLDATQKAAMLQFVRDGGGLVVMHGGVDVHTWKDYTDMIGGEFVAHPFNNGDWPIFPFPIVNEDASTAMTSFLPHHFVKQDEIYVVRNFSRDESTVLLSLDKNLLDFSHVTSAVPPSHDVPVTWIKQYGKGRVFVSTFGHAKEAFDDPDVARMYTEAIKWALRLSGDDAQVRKEAQAKKR